MNPDKLRPLHDQIVVRRKPFDDTTKGGLFIPEIARAEHKVPRGRGIVLAVGPGKLATKRDPHDADKRVPTGKREPMDVAVGDEVVFSRLSGKPLDVPGDDILMITQEHILAVLEPD